MKILKQVLGKHIEFGGKEHTGWLPPKSAVPRATPVESALVDIRILETEEGFIVEWKSKKPDQSNDSVHATLEEALRQAKDQFGIEASEWQLPGGDI